MSELNSLPPSHTEPCVWTRTQSVSQTVRHSGALAPRLAQLPALGLSSSAKRTSPNPTSKLPHPRRTAGTMEGAGNGTDANYRSPLSALYNGTLCFNVTDAGDNSSSFGDARCGGSEERRMMGGSLDPDANPIIIAIIITALYSIVCVVGLVGNVLVMYIIVR